MKSITWHDVVNIVVELDVQTQVYVNAYDLAGGLIGSYRIVRYSTHKYGVQYRSLNLIFQGECKLRRGSINTIFDYLHREWLTVH